MLLKFEFVLCCCYSHLIDSFSKTMHCACDKTKPPSEEKKQKLEANTVEATALALTCTRAHMHTLSLAHTHTHMLIHSSRCVSVNTCGRAKWCNFIFVNCILFHLFGFIVIIYEFFRSFLCLVPFCLGNILEIELKQFDEVFIPGIFCWMALVRLGIDICYVGKSCHCETMTNLLPELAMLLRDQSWARWEEAKSKLGNSISSQGLRHCGSLTVSLQGNSIISFGFPRCVGVHQNYVIQQNAISSANPS